MKALFLTCAVMAAALSGCAGQEPFADNADKVKLLLTRPGR